MKKKKVFKIVLILIAIIALIIINALFIAPHTIEIREETLVSNKIADNFDDFVIAYFSDLHYGDLTKDDDLDEAINIINSISPDVVIFGGDLIDKNATSVDNKLLINKLKTITAKNKKYAVLGDHDLINEERKEEVINILENSNFVILDNENQKVFNGSENYINIVGFGSMVNGYIDTQSSYNELTSNDYTIVVSHCPDAFDLIDALKTDYVLAGHSHGQQIYIPLINMLYRKDGFEKYCKGKHYNEDAILDISNGVGLTNKSIRLFSDAEVVFYKLKSE